MSASKQYYIKNGKYVIRENPLYEPNHCFTVTKCDKCGEYYEAWCEVKHICEKQNSYPQDDKAVD